MYSGTNFVFEEISMTFNSVPLFAQTAAPEQTANIIGYYVGQFLGILIMSLIVSGVFHLFSRNNPKIAFNKVFPYVFVVILVLSVLGQILPIK